MRRSMKMLAAALFAGVALLAGSAAKAQDAPPAGGFKNAYLNLNKSGKVVLTYTLWKDQIGKGKYTLKLLTPDCRYFPKYYYRQFLPELFSKVSWRSSAGCKQVF